MPPIRLVTVDDDADVRLFVRSAVESSGAFTVVGEAADGAAALDVIRAQQPDVVLLDLDMPKLGGLDTLPLIREQAPLAQVVVLSAFRRADYEHHVLAGGAVGYIEKGLTGRQLADDVLALTGLLHAVDRALADMATDLPAEPASASKARRFVDDVLARWDCGALLDDVQLLVTELVTNAVVHAHSEAQVVVRLLPDALRVDVVDQAPHRLPPAATELAADAESGRGLYLVETLARSWGIEETETGKSVWFEMPRPDQASQSR